MVKELHEILHKLENSYFVHGIESFDEEIKSNGRKNKWKQHIAMGDSNAHFGKEETQASGGHGETTSGQDKVFLRQLEKNNICDLVYLYLTQMALLTILDKS